MAGAVSDFADRIEAMEAFILKGIEMRDLPLAALQRKLETSWQPEAGRMFTPGSVTPVLVGYQIVAAEINAAGGSAHALGNFACARNSIGDYTISSLPFRATANVTLAVIGTPLAGIVLKAPPGATTFSVNTFNTNTGALIDAAWHFIAIAPVTGS